MAKIAELLGTPFMPWQRAAVDVACEYDPETGIPFYGEVNLLVMRQQGKTTIELAALVDRFVSFTTRQRCVYSAQTGADARKKVLQDWAPDLELSPLGSVIKDVVRSNGHESIVCKNGSFVETMASLAASGHGFSVHFAMIDEAWKDEDDRREQAIDPAMLTIPDAQKWVVSTAGDDRSTYLRRKVEDGRSLVEEDSGQGVCYIEYSVPDDVSPFISEQSKTPDMDVMVRYMPALCPTPGPCSCSPDWRHTVTQEALTTRMQGMDRKEARRAYANQWVSGGGERKIPADLWDAVQKPSAAPEGRVTFAVDVNVERSSAAIAVSDGVAVEVVEHESGTGWLADWFKAKPNRRRWPVVVDGSGPAETLIPELEKAGCKVVARSRAEVASACGRMYDAIADGNVQVRPSCQALDDAAAGVATRPVGDRFVWSRSSSPVDVTPLMAATLAFGSSEKARTPGISIVEF